MRAALAAAVVLSALAATADDKPQALDVEMGAAAYRVHCAVCHGARAEGDGPMAERLRFAPPDLTRLARRNKGKFDAELVQRIIDGRRPVKGHGGPEMPVWGDAFLDNREGFSREAVRRKIEQIVQFLASVQKP